MNEPKRIQRKRTKGWRMPDNTVYVGRPSKWGNPFIGNYAYERYRKYIKEKCNDADYHKRLIDELRGKNLACWCPLNGACHADILLEVANERIDKI